MEAQPTPANSKAADAMPDLQQRIDRAATGVHAAIDSASGAARPTLDRYVAEAHDLVDRMADAVSASGASLDSKTSEASQLGRHARDEVRGYIDRHPVATLGLALGAGFLLSRLLRRL